ncbi:MAG: NUDIX hydrolase [Patescibacteria group bacterium]
MIKQLSTKIVYENQWMRVREDTVEFPNEHQGIYGVVEKSDFALIIPFDGEHFYLVRQYRYPIQQFSLEFPQGKHEESVKIFPLDLAKAELKEETGLVTKNIKEIGFLHEAPGYANQGFHIFLATELSQQGQKLDLTEEGLVIVKLSVSEFEQMIRIGEITDAPTISAYTLFNLVI